MITRFIDVIPKANWRLSGRKAARGQDRKPPEALQETVKQCLERQSWAEFVGRNERRAAELGITEDDVPSLVE